MNAMGAGQNGFLVPQTTVKMYENKNKKQRSTNKKKLKNNRKMRDNKKLKTIGNRLEWILVSSNYCKDV